MKTAEKPLISIIMPVYNAQKTLNESVQSVLAQTYPHFELILVDDGSRDESLALCRKLAGEDGRIRVVAQENSGPAAARNAGLAQAEGAFLMFADSDDLLVPEACETLLNAVGDCDMAISHFYFDVGTVSSVRGLLKGERVLEEAEFFHVLADKPGTFYFSALWNKIYRTEIVRGQGLRFDSFLDWGEDFAFNMRYYRDVRSVAVTEKPLYHYIKNPASTSFRTLLRIGHSCRIKARLYRELKRLYQSKGLYGRYRFHVTKYIFNVTLAD